MKKGTKCSAGYLKEICKKYGRKSKKCKSVKRMCK